MKNILFALLFFASLIGCGQVNPHDVSVFTGEPGGHVYFLVFDTTGTTKAQTNFRLPWDSLTAYTGVTIANLQSIFGADPNADRILFWDDSAGEFKYLRAGSGINIVSDSISSTGGVAIGNDRIVVGTGASVEGTDFLTWDGSTLVAAGDLFGYNLTLTGDLDLSNGVNYTRLTAGSYSDQVITLPSTTGTLALTSQFEVGADVTDETNVKAALDGATITSATVASGDKVLIQDVDDSDNLKTVTAQSIADLASGSGILISETTVTSSQILNLSTTPVTLISAQGAGTYIIPQWIIVSMNYNSSPYDLRALRIEYAAGAGLTIDTFNSFTSTADDFLRSQVGDIAGSSSAINVAVRLAAATSPTGGDSDFKIIIYYTVETI